MRRDQLQEVFEACLEKVRQVRSRMRLACANWGRVGRRRAFGQPQEEYAADFVLVAKAWMRLKPEVELIQQKMGLALISTNPYPLYPIREYFQ